MGLTLKKSNNVAILTRDIQLARKFYADVLHLPIVKESATKIEFQTGESCFYIIKNDEIQNTVLEYLVNNLEAAKEYLLENGCEIVKWEGKGRDCYMKDPFGTIFNLWEEKTEK